MKDLLTKIRHEIAKSNSELKYIYWKNLPQDEQDNLVNAFNFNDNAIQIIDSVLEAVQC